MFFEYPLAVQLHCTGLLATTSMEALTSRKPCFRMKLEFCTALSHLTGQNLWDLVPGKWDIMTLSSGKQKQNDENDADVTAKIAHYNPAKKGLTSIPLSKFSKVTVGMQR